jgi:hypothetical protein
MIDWLVNEIIAAGSWVSGLFVSKDAPNFAVVSGMTAIVLVVVFVFFLFVCSARRSRKAGDQ